MENKIDYCGRYNKLGFEKYQTWSDKDLSNFLVWDSFNEYSSTEIGRNLLQSFASDIESCIQPDVGQMLFDLVDKIFLILAKVLKRRRKKVLFQNSRYPVIIKTARKKYNIGIIEQGKRDKLFLRKDFNGYINTGEMARCLLDYLKDKNAGHLRKMVRMADDSLQAIKPDYLVLGNDSTPVERALAIACKKLGIVTLEIQHGTYMDPAGHLQDGKFRSQPLTGGKVADFSLLWGEYFKRLYLEQKLKDSQKVFIIGYPYLIKNNKISSPKNKNNILKVCFLAQDFERYNNDFLQPKLETVSNISAICRKLGLDFVYRPHPWGEDVAAMQKLLPNIKFTPKNEKLKETFEKLDIFIGVSSTALVEGVINSKLVLQVMSYPVHVDNFEELGACSKTAENFSELEDYLKKIAEAQDLEKFKIKVDNNYIETRYNPGQRFLEIMEEIEKQS